MLKVDMSPGCDKQWIWSEWYSWQLQGILKIRCYCNHQEWRMRTRLDAQIGQVVYQGSPHVKWNIIYYINEIWNNKYSTWQFGSCRHFIFNLLALYPYDSNLIWQDWISKGYLWKFMGQAILKFINFECLTMLSL